MFSGRLGSTTALPSSTFVVLPQRAANKALTAFVIKGAGWGHGAGMCQRGARTHAQQGWNALRIINFYFRGVEVRRAY
jgi:SpoIID/LytB domain protein